MPVTGQLKRKYSAVLLAFAVFVGLGALRMGAHGPSKDPGIGAAYSFLASTLGLLALGSFLIAAACWLEWGPRPAKNVFLYDVVLYFLGLSLLEAGLVIRLAAGTSSPADQRFWSGLILGFVIAGAVVLMLSALRFSGFRWAYPLTFAFSILILVWVPLGTALGLAWLLFVRRQERV